MPNFRLLNYYMFFILSYLTIPFLLAHFILSLYIPLQTYMLPHQNTFLFTHHFPSTSFLPAPLEISLIFIYTDTKIKS